MRHITYPAPQLLAKRSPTEGRREDDKRGAIWTDKEVAYLIANYRLHGPQRCAREIRRSEMSVRIKAHRMGLSSAPPMTIGEIVSRLTNTESSNGAKDVAA